ncbi:MAG: phosphoenolpyruvate--protein phosphotransferase [Lachnospiraceae bacterium]|nr:phosphoenolpyruvate--protein phosphotransferase [Lachnospiraceae bacterium]
MRRYFGRAVHGGTAAGPVFVVKKESREIVYARAEDFQAQIARVQRAVGQSREELKALSHRALHRAGEDGAAIFAAHEMILEDEEYLETIYGMIRREKVAAEYAVAVTAQELAGRFERMEDECIRARAADVRDVSGQVLRNLAGNPGCGLRLAEPAVIVAQDLTPGETMQMEREKILALVTVQGSPNSHTSILARMMDIPAVVGVPVELEHIRSGMRAVVDGTGAEVTFEPDEDLWEAAERSMARERDEKRLLQSLRGEESVTRSGRKVQICANIGGLADVKGALENDAEGIGLFRSECLYLGRAGFPPEEEQFQVYRQALEAMGEKKVVIRTLDIGADKTEDYFRLETEANPALGYRGIRICLKRPDIFKTQLRALLRASVYGKLSVLYPMITSVKEMERIYEIVDEVKKELSKERIPFRLPRQGIMIETPAAVMISHRLAQMADFFSIGTNDLTQYTLAVDRQNGQLEEFYDPRHEAVLCLIRIAVENAHKYGKRAGICGELAADLELTESLLEMGVDELSVPPAMVLPLRRRVREI